LLDNRKDLLTIEIFKESEGKDKKSVLAEGSGSYLENISFTENEKEVIIWSINDEKLSTDWLTPSDKLEILPSDSGNRTDLISIKNE
jgi:hypothetical protein